MEGIELQPQAQPYGVMGKCGVVYVTVDGLTLSQNITLIYISKDNVTSLGLGQAQTFLAVSARNLNRLLVKNSVS